MERNKTASADDIRRAQQVATAMEGIRRYLDAHPNASDSLRGVRYWLRDLPEEPGEEAVAIALDRLQQLGEVEARQVLGGVVVYARAPRAQGRDS